MSSSRNLMEKKRKTAIETIADENAPLLDKMLVLFYSQRKVLSSLNHLINLKDDFNAEELKALRDVIKSLLHGDSVVVRYLESEIYKSYKIN